MFTHRPQTRFERFVPIPVARLERLSANGYGYRRMRSLFMQN